MRMKQTTTLKRSLSLPMMVLYGLGTTIGAGIYALVGEIAGVAGYYAPVSFLLASFMVGFTALSFAELASRYPVAAGAAMYVRQGYAWPRLSTMVGLLVILGGLVSAAAMVNGLAGYLEQYVAFDRHTVIFTTVLILAAIASWGIAESVAIAALITLIEIAGLLLVIVVSSSAFATLPQRFHELLPGWQLSDWIGIGAGIMLAFYAYIGFEDMVDLAEEVNEVQRNLPAAILWTLGITMLLYLLLMTAAVLALPLHELARSKAPLAYIYQQQTGQPATFISAIAMFAITNGALIQIIMASRVFYGLGKRGELPSWLAVVNPLTRTPLAATALASTMMLILALLGGLASLAQATSVIMLSLFGLVNLALWRIKRREQQPPAVRTYPEWVPLVGFFIIAGFLLAQVAVWLVP
jgi:amino acid transporter